MKVRYISSFAYSCHKKRGIAELVTKHNISVNTDVGYSILFYSITLRHVTKDMSILNANLKEVAQVFFKLGCIAFGGPAAHVAMMEEEIVDKRKWFDRQHFLDLMGATNLIPGPNSTEMTMHCGYERAGWAGLFVAGACFIFPAVVITGLLAYLYVTYGQLPAVAPFVEGIKPAVLAIIAGAIYKLGKKALKNWELGVLGVIVLVVSVLGVNEILALLVAGVLGAIYFYGRASITQGKLKMLLPLAIGPLATTTVVKISTAQIFWTFLKVGAPKDG